MELKPLFFDIIFLVIPLVPLFICFRIVFWAFRKKQADILINIGTIGLAIGNVFFYFISVFVLGYGVCYLGCNPHSMTSIMSAVPSLVFTILSACIIALNLITCFLDRNKKHSLMNMIYTPFGIMALLVDFMLIKLFIWTFIMK